jgi:integrase
VWETTLNGTRRLGASELEHHLFPFGVGSNHRPDPSRPMTKFAIKNNWNYIRKLAGSPKLRIYDLRHTAITRLAEKGVPIAMIVAFAGHISGKMCQHYTTVSMQALRAMARQAAP